MGVPLVRESGCPLTPDDLVQVVPDFSFIDPDEFRLPLWHSSFLRAIVHLRQPPGRVGFLFGVRKPNFTPTSGLLPIS